MTYSPQDVKSTLTKLISDMQDNAWMYSINSQSFTRNRKISFSDTLLSTICMQKSASKLENLKYFDYSSSAPTASALIQQRKKLASNAFESLFYSFSNAFSWDQTLKGYDPIAVDGSDIYIPRNPKDIDTYRITDKYGKGFNMLHLNAAYHLLNRIYIDADLQSINHINEYRSMCDMIDRYAASYPNKKPVFIADRGFCSFNVMAHAIENNVFFLIRARDKKNSMVASLNIPDTEFEMLFDRHLTRRKTKTVIESPEKYKYISNGVFDYLEPKSTDTYRITFRIVRLMLPNGNTETIFTNLPQKDFTIEELRDLYNMRWGIETSFRDVKYAAGLLFFHSKRKELIIQEIYAKLILYNFCEIITGSIVVEKKDRKYSYRINFSIAIAICTEYLRQSLNMSSMDVENLLLRELIAVRPGRTNPRYLKARTVTSFQYR